MPLRLYKQDKKVIDAFIDQQPQEGNKLSTDGRVLDGHWMGGSALAFWKGDKINLPDRGSRAAQTVQRAIERKAPRNWLGGEHLRPNQGLREPKYELVDRWWTGDYGPSESILIGDKELKSGHGTRDSVDVLQSGDDVYVIVSNSALPYIGAAHYNLAWHTDIVDERDEDELEVYLPTAEVFFQEHQVDEAFGDQDPFYMSAPEVLAVLDPWLA